MPKEDEVKQLPLAGFEEPNETAASVRWKQELGKEVESLAHMMRKPTEHRPFVYEVRFDLLPAKKDNALAVFKGFGEEGSIVAFHNAPSFLQLLRGAQAQMLAGKMVWYPDQYQNDSYSDRVARFSSGEFYRV